jgi:hypothetical protein
MSAAERPVKRYTRVVFIQTHSFFFPKMGKRLLGKQAERDALNVNNDVAIGKSSVVLMVVD